MQRIPPHCRVMITLPQSMLIGLGLAVRRQEEPPGFALRYTPTKLPAVTVRAHDIRD